jgi:hypothetical protein
LLAMRNIAGSNREFSRMARRSSTSIRPGQCYMRASLGPMGTGETSPAA